MNCHYCEERSIETIFGIAMCKAHEKEWKRNDTKMRKVTETSLKLKKPEIDKNASILRWDS